MKRIIYNFALISLLSLSACTGGKQQTAEARRHSLPAVKDVVMYQVNPRIFAPQNSFKAVEQHLDSIRDLGTNVVWFMPLNEVGKEKSVNSPYCVKDYRALNAEFGTMEDFKSLVAACHQRDMSVIIDWVANHTSWDNVWVTEHPEWYTKDEKGNIISPALTGWLDVADLDFDNTEMRLAMIDAMKFWVTEVGVDGFRCDAADLVPFDFWKQAVDSLRNIPEHPLLLLAEGKRRDHFKAGFDINYAWDYLETLREVFIKKAPAEELFATNVAEYDSIPDGKLKLRFTTNHDEAVKMSPIKEFGNQQGSMAAFVSTIYLNGGALLYGSQEVGYPETINFFVYTPMDWSANSALYQEYKQLLSLYNQYPALRKGTLKTYPHADVLLFEKESEGEKILVAVNVRESLSTVSLPQAWCGHACTNLYDSTEAVLGNELKLEGYGYKILKW